jgi:putative ABC transport system ATP-binding protein
VTATPPLFAFERVSVRGGEKLILRDLDATVPDGGLTAIIGPSGSGKSTLLRLCNRLEVPATGRVLFRGLDVGALDPLALRRRVGMVFQRATTFGGTVRDNLRVAAPRGSEAAYAVALERAELPASFLDRQADEISGGEAQRVCLARALAAEPEVLLMDEPTSALDRGPKLALERLARRLVDQGVPVLWVTHDLDQAARIGDWRLELAGGRLAGSGPVARPSRPPVAAEADAAR